jgi:hypothetical protein
VPSMPHERLVFGLWAARSTYYVFFLQPVAVTLRHPLVASLRPVQNPYQSARGIILI